LKIFVIIEKVVKELPIAGVQFSLRINEGGSQMLAMPTEAEQPVETQ